MRLCSYTVVHDYGFAPNPFWGRCTLAACTPNHQGIRLEPGVWIMGHSDAAHGKRLVYAMRLAEVLGLDAYFHDERFQRKKPRLDRTWKEECGDNIYYREGGEWVQAPTLFHDDDKRRAQDTSYAIVFISNHFYYFGENAIEIPAKFAGLVRDRQGCKVNHDADLVKAFIAWLKSSFTPGRHGNPRDAAKETEGCMIANSGTARQSSRCPPGVGPGENC